jgi:sarcosine oxidase subunit gamma
MSDALLQRRAAVDPARLPSVDGLAVALKPPVARFVLRGDGAVAALAGAAFGAPMPVRPLSSSAADRRAALWLGPDEWLLLAPLAEQAPLAEALRTALATVAHSLVDVAHRQVAFAISGRLAARVLTSGCPLDLSTRAFPVGAVTRTLFHKADIVLWREAEGFHLEVWRSFAPYVVGHLDAAQRGAQDLADTALP